MYMQQTGSKRTMRNTSNDRSEYGNNYREVDPSGGSEHGSFLPSVGNQKNLKISIVGAADSSRNGEFEASTIGAVSTTDQHLSQINDFDNGFGFQNRMGDFPKTVSNG